MVNQIDRREVERKELNERLGGPPSLGRLHQEREDWLEAFDKKLAERSKAANSVTT